MLPFIERVFSGCPQVPKMAKVVAATGSWKLEIIK
jgi:hypothetical protein